MVALLAGIAKKLAGVSTAFDNPQYKPQTHNSIALYKLLQQTACDPMSQPLLCTDLTPTPHQSSNTGCLKQHCSSSLVFIIIVIFTFIIVISFRMHLLRLTAWQAEAFEVGRGLGDEALQGTATTARSPTVFPLGGCSIELALWLLWLMAL